MLKQGDILYHGSYAKVEAIDLSKCASGKDFGRGFYLTSDLGQARRFIALSLNKAHAIGHVRHDQGFGFVSAFKVRSIDGLGVYEFSNADSAWLRFVACNRRAQLADTLAPLISPDLRHADVVIGKIANDKTNRVVTAYLSGLYGEIGNSDAERIAIGLLLPDRLKDQHCFRTQMAIDALELVGVEQYDV